jgi:RES domain-containing protein
MRMVYTADSPSLAALEVLVGLGDASFLPGYVLCSVEIPDAAVETLDPKALPASWQSYPAPPELQRIGDAWLKERQSLALRVPSVVVPRQPNFLLNPAHKAFAKLRVGKAEPFVFDERLMKRRQRQ